MRYTLLLCLLANTSQFAFSQKLKPSDLYNLNGSWTGTLTYLDYNSGKPYTMPAEIKTLNSADPNIIAYSMIYPNEPKANKTDSIIISNNGRSFNAEKIIKKKNLGKDSIEIITEKTGTDGNDNKPATIRRIYLLSKNIYRVRKEVQFEVGKEWMLRHEYKFERSL